MEKYFYLISITEELCSYMHTQLFFWSIKQQEYLLLTYHILNDHQHKNIQVQVFFFFFSLEPINSNSSYLSVIHTYTHIHMHKSFLMYIHTYVKNHSRWNTTFSIVFLIIIVFRLLVGLLSTRHQQPLLSLGLSQERQNGLIGIFISELICKIQKQWPRM